jgi:hypothetical protein
VDAFNHKLWQDEINRIYSQRLRLMELLPPSPPLPWHRRQWNRLAWRISNIRERLGELIAGREFGDY